MAWLAALVPPPRMHLTRYHGVFAPHHLEDDPADLRGQRATYTFGAWKSGKLPAKHGVAHKGDLAGNLYSFLPNWLQAG